MRLFFAVDAWFRWWCEKLFFKLTYVKLDKSVIRFQFRVVKMKISPSFCMEISVVVQSTFENYMESHLAYSISWWCNMAMSRKSFNNIFTHIFISQFSLSFSLSSSLRTAATLFLFYTYSHFSWVMFVRISKSCAHKRQIMSRLLHVKFWQMSDRASLNVE